MADVVITLKVMPSSPDVDLEELKKAVGEKILAYAGADISDEKQTKVEEEPVAFGLKALLITFVVDEDKGSPDPLADDIATLENVNSVQVVHVTRAIG